MGYNNSVLGTVVYDIYVKNGESLTLLGSSTSNSATVKLPNINSPKLVVKSSYSVFKGASSSGVEVTADYKGISPSDVHINPSSYSISWTAGSNFNHDPKGHVKVTAHGEDITTEASMHRGAMINKTTGEKATINDLSNNAGTYLVTYDVKYADIVVGKVEVTVTVS